MTPQNQSYREIPLTQGQVALVSANRYEELMLRKWCAAWSSRTRSFYAVTGRPQIKMHRLILGLQSGDSREGDHRSGITLDNRDENLRIATPQQNRYNKATPKHNTTGHKGITYEKGRYRVRISVNGKRINLGSRAVFSDAVTLYTEAEKQYYGEFARSSQDG